MVTRDRGPLAQKPKIRGLPIRQRCWRSEGHLNRQALNLSTRTVVAPGFGYESGIRRRAKGLLSKTAKQPRRQIRRRYGLQNEPNLIGERSAVRGAWLPAIENVVRADYRAGLLV